MDFHTTEYTATFPDASIMVGSDGIVSATMKIQWLSVPVGDIEVISVEPHLIEVEWDWARILIHENGMVEIENIGATQQLYHHRSLLVDPFWVRDYPAKQSYIWMDSTGHGSLHYAECLATAVTVGDVSQITLPVGETMCHVVFPVRMRAIPDRPLIWTTNGGDAAAELASVEAVATQAETPGTPFESNPFGIVSLGKNLYTNGSTPIDDAGTLRYVVEPAILVALQASIARLQACGVKVIGYEHTPNFRTQSIAVTLGVLNDVRTQLGLDGWYVDYSAYGEPFSSCLPDSIDFLSGLRVQVGETGTIVHHHSVDVLGVFSGVLCPHLDYYSDVVVRGESAWYRIVQTDVDVDAVIPPASWTTPSGPLTPSFIGPETVTIPGTTRDLGEDGFLLAYGTEATYRHMCRPNGAWIRAVSDDFVHMCCVRSHGGLGGWVWVADGFMLPTIDEIAASLLDCSERFAVMTRPNNQITSGLAQAWKDWVAAQ